MRIKLRNGALSLLVVIFAGCDGGFDCPIDPPDCCYNVLFGCGPFDLPSGCSCERYGLSYNGAATVSSPRVAKSRGLSGTWGGALRKSGGGCVGLLPRVSGAIAVNESQNRITVTVPGYGKLRGLKNRSGYAVAGVHRPLFGACAVSVRAVFVKGRDGIGSLTVDISNGCGRAACSAQYRGTIQQWGYNPG